MFKLSIVLLSLAATVVFAVHPWEPAPRDSHWMQKHERLLNMTHKHASEVKAVFLGDSITEGWAGNGKDVWKVHYEARKAFNYGIGGDQTQHIIWRIENGEFEKVSPKVIVLMIGTNNISAGYSAADIAKGVDAILKLLHSKMPHAKILLVSVLPRFGQKLDKEVHDVNGLIEKLADNKVVFWHDFTHDFETKLGVEKEKLYVPDHVHLSALGYQVWFHSMAAKFDKLIA